MITLLALYAAFAFCIAASVSSTDLRPRFLQDADRIPLGGIFNGGVVTLPLVKARSSKLPAKTKRQSLVQVPLGDLADSAYVRALNARKLKKLKIISGRRFGYRWSKRDFPTRYRHKLSSIVLPFY
jgi:hypothetical protein